MKPKKLNSQEILSYMTQAISDQVKHKFAKTSMFSNNSLAFYGVRVKYKIEVETFARGTEKQTVEDDFENMEGEWEEDQLPKPEKMEVEGDLKAGK